jgi:glutamyl-tRNA(Gln) amidotransferase subunit E
MNYNANPADNLARTRSLVGYVPRKLATRATYEALGFKSGLEIHQQVKTAQKLFCRCPAFVYQKEGEYDAEVIRHMRPTLSEMGEYDGTALMEKKTRKNIFYRIKYETACTYDIDDTPPFPLNQEALRIAVRVALMLNLRIVGELHIARKQYLDGSIPTGFQRTGIIGVEGSIPQSGGTVRIIQMSLEEDSCREVADRGHNRVYTTDRLGIPLIETVTYPDMKTPDEVAEAGNYLRFLARSSGEVQTGIGAARQDVNVSIEGGTRVEIKGVARIRWIPELVHNEAFRQKALLEIRRILRERVPKPADWMPSHADLDTNRLASDFAPLRQAAGQGHRITAINLPHFKNLLSFFTQPGRTFADELSGRVKVIACLEQPNMLHSEAVDNQSGIHPNDLEVIREKLKATDGDAQIIVWGASEDVDTAIETIDERCRLAMEGVPNETRKSLPDGTTIFERVLPGPDRMYPDTDSAPISLPQEFIDACAENRPPAVADQMARLAGWGVPQDAHEYLLRRDLTGLVGRIAADLGLSPGRIGTMLGHTLKHLEGTLRSDMPFSYERVYELCRSVQEQKLDAGILRQLLSVVYQHPGMTFGVALAAVGFKRVSTDAIILQVPQLSETFDQIKTSRDPEARLRWIMGELSVQARGNMPMRDLRSHLETVAAHV